MFTVGNNIHSDCNVFNNLPLYEIILILLLFRYECMVVALMGILDGVHLLHTYPYMSALVLSL